MDKLRAMKLAKAAELIENGIDETLSYNELPPEHWRCLRTNNPLERLMREIRRRTGWGARFPMASPSNVHTTGTGLLTSSRDSRRLLYPNPLLVASVRNVTVINSGMQCVGKPNPSASGTCGGGGQRQGSDVADQLDNRE